VNQDAEYEGPYLIPTAPVAGPLLPYQRTGAERDPSSSVAVNADIGCAAGVRVVTVKEEECMQAFFPIPDLPKSVSLLMTAEDS
jgi:hypothetical protein